MSPTKVLVVDDDLDILQITKDNLELDGFAVSVASTGKDALSAVKRNGPDLVILDIMLPDLDGVQICRIIQKQSQAPIVMLTAKDTVSDKVLCLESGADDYVVKPFDYLEPAARINACLRRGKGPPPPEHVLEAGSLRIDPNARRVDFRQDFQS
ncbi:MAG: response regulator transcription factor [Deltaproteobacteria bacterium]|nr:response regulator transcription factor [Deltaproteobacteria bacterium]